MVTIWNSGFTSVFTGCGIHIYSALKILTLRLLLVATLNHKKCYLGIGPTYLGDTIPSLFLPNLNLAQVEAILQNMSEKS